ncbi:MAG: type I-C CRISPR-associated protein Cas8c/Csd1 [Bacteroidales bacterium]|nr:type I-C CRISPR-associated protein Cas8c/Csd1 [Bacteroidales bacterium]
MILKALYDYYHHSPNVAPLGKEKKEISFIIVLDSDGKFIRVEDTRIDGRGKIYLVPKSIGRTSKPIPNRMWDNTEYVLGISKKDKSEKQDKADKAAREKNSLFVDLCIKLAKENPETSIFQAIRKFYENGNIEDLKQSKYWSLLEENQTKNLTFKLQDSLTLAVDEACLIENDDKENVVEGLCLITGTKGPIVRLTTSTPIPGCQSVASLVSFQKGSGYDSYGKTQCYNAPISVEAEGAFSEAIMALKAADSRNWFKLGDRRFLFWAANNNEASDLAQENFFALMGWQQDDDPNLGIEKVNKAYKAIWSGQVPSDNGDRFFILGLAPNIGRIAVVYWSQCTVKELAQRILNHFEGMEIVDTRKNQQPYYGLYSILKSASLNGDTTKLSPNLSEALVKSIFQGTPYPYPLYTAILTRIRAELSEDFGINPGRCGFIKAYLNQKNDNEIKIQVMLDKENQNQGYLCGRLFAVLEKIQSDAQGAQTIRERYMNAASATPAAVFPTILNLSNHHLEKLNPGACIWYEKLKQEIFDKIISNGFPAHLDLHDQGRFFVGYYQQRSDLYSSK